MFLIFGCQPKKGVPAESRIAIQFFEVLELAKDNIGCILLPDAGHHFNAWKPNYQCSEKGEKIAIMVKPIHFFGPYPQQITEGASQVFDYSRMIGRFFEPDDKICIIFDNISYGKLRELPEFAVRFDSSKNSNYRPIHNELVYGDMPRAREWANTFEEGIKAYGFSEDQIYRYTDADYNTMDNAIRSGASSASQKIAQNAREGRRTLLLCFYAGHGAQVAGLLGTYALLNSNQRGNQGNRFPLEGILSDFCAR